MVPAPGTRDPLRVFTTTSVNCAIMGIFLSQIVTYPSLKRLGARLRD